MKGDHDLRQKLETKWGVVEWPNWVQGCPIIRKAEFLEAQHWFIINSHWNILYLSDDEQAAEHHAKHNVLPVEKPHFVSVCVYIASPILVLE